VLNISRITVGIWWCVGYDG